MSALSLVYLDPDTDLVTNLHWLKRVERKPDGFIEGLLRRAGAVYDGERPVVHAPGCRDGDLLERLIELAE